MQAPPMSGTPIYGVGDLDITCVSPWNSSGGHKKAGTLVTPRHIIGAAHYEYSVGTVVRFVEKNGTVHDRTVTGKARHPECRNYTPDLTIYTLDSDLPLYDKALFCNA